LFSIFFKDNCYFLLINISRAKGSTCKIFILWANI